MSAGYATVPGRLRHRIDIQAVTKTVDAIGAEVITYTKVRTVWGSIVTKSGRELETGLQVAGNATVTIRIRYWPTLTESHRFVHAGKTYNIDNINNVDQRNKILECSCVEDKSPRGDSSGS